LQRQEESALPATREDRGTKGFRADTGPDEDLDSSQRLPKRDAQASIETVLQRADSLVQNLAIPRPQVEIAAHDGLCRLLEARKCQYVTPQLGRLHLAPFQT
jgi:hypothetical protein